MGTLLICTDYTSKCNDNVKLRTNHFLPTIKAILSTSSSAFHCCCRSTYHLEQRQPWHNLPSHCKWHLLEESFRSGLQYHVSSHSVTLDLDSRSWEIPHLSPTISVASYWYPLTPCIWFQSVTTQLYSLWLDKLQSFNTKPPIHCFAISSL